METGIKRKSVMSMLEAAGDQRDRERERYLAGSLCKSETGPTQGYA